MWPDTAPGVSASCTGQHAKLRSDWLTAQWTIFWGKYGKDLEKTRCKASGNALLNKAQWRKVRVFVIDSMITELLIICRSGTAYTQTIAIK